MSSSIFLLPDLIQLSSLLVDAAVKGTVLLVLTAVVAVGLRRDSAATRHLVWLLALAVLLAVPALSAMLPQWQVLPDWAQLTAAPAAAVTLPASVTDHANAASDIPQNEPAPVAESPWESTDQPAAVLPDPLPALQTPASTAAPSVWSWNWLTALPVVWSIGFCALVLRLLAARLMLWNTERQATAICEPAQAPGASHDPLITVFQTTCAQLGMIRSVTLLVHPGPTIPVVWGIFHCRLMLPAAARQWSGEQLRSVLLHELAHIRRRDTLAQLLAQLTCALYWFNPLAWFANWRLGVERERACDDLVLAGGVRPSLYARHLLEVATAHSSVRGTHSCALAMARPSSLERRLMAILSDKLNRRAVSVTISAISLAVAVAVAVPIAMLRAGDEKQPPTNVSPTQPPPQPTANAVLPPGTEEQLQWGPAVNGLRAAIVRPQALGEPAAAEIFDFKFVLQNVSEAPIHFSTANAGPKSHALNMRLNGATLTMFHDAQPAAADFTLRSREVAILRLFSQPTPGESITGEDPAMTFSAELIVENAPQGAWQGTLVTADTSATVSAYGLMPKDKDAQALFKTWSANSRRNGNIPGALIGLLAESVTTFTKYNPTWETTPQLLKMLPRFDATRDWSGQEAIALLDELATLQSSPIGMALARDYDRAIRTGTPLPPQLANAPWGEALPNGLRMAWLLEPHVPQHRLNTPLKARILIHNSGKMPVVFRTRTWHQVGHTARDAKGVELNVTATEWTTIGRFVPFRLAPGEFVELSAPGIGVGMNRNDDDWQNTRVGTWIDVKAGDEVTVTTGPVPMTDWSEKVDVIDGEPRWWLDFITARLNRTLPLPAEKDERQRLLYKVAIDLFGTPVSAKINAAFVADHEPTAVDSLAKQLFQRPGLHAWAGPLVSAPTRFRVLPADPDAAKRPRVVNSPGRYTLGDNIRLIVSRRPRHERIVNEASIQFFSPDPTKPAPGEPHQLKLPDGYDTWSAAWVRGGTQLWVQQQTGIRRYDFSNPADVKEEVAAPETVPADIREALQKSVILPEPKPVPSPPAASAKPSE